MTVRRYRRSIVFRVARPWPGQHEPCSSDVCRGLFERRRMLIGGPEWPVGTFYITIAPRKLPQRV